MKNALMLMLVLVACSRRNEDTTLTSAKIDAATTPREAESLDAVKRWNGAMSQRDLTLLANVYGTNVTFYGVPMRHDQVLQVLSDAFVKDPSFTQSVENAREVSPQRIELKRTWITHGSSHSEPTWLELGREDGKLVVVKQGDATSDARERAQSAAPKQDYCEGLAERVVLSTDKARALVDVPRGPQQSGYANPSRVVATPPEWPTYSIAVIDQTHAKPVAIGWFDVVPQTGEVSDAFTGETLKPDADLIAQMKKCPK